MTSLILNFKNYLTTKTLSNIKSDMPRRLPKQFSFFSKQSLSFGGSLLKNSHARVARPLNSKEFVHIVLKSEIAVGDLRLTRKKDHVEAIIKSQLDRFKIKVKNMAIASNHIHILILFKSRRLYFCWIRRITGLIARLMLNAEKGKPSLKKFWTHRPFTRVVFWGIDLRGVAAYIEKNELEAIGFTNYIPRHYKIPKLSSTA